MLGTDTPSYHKGNSHSSFADLKACSRDPTLSFCRWRNGDTERKELAQGQHSALAGLGSETELPNSHPAFLPQHHIISTDEALMSLSMRRGLDDTHV